MKENMNGFQRYRLFRQAVRFSLIVGLVLLVPGCLGSKKTKEDPFFTKWKIMAEESKGYSPPAKRKIARLPEKSAAALVETPTKEKKIEEKALPTTKVTMKVHSIDVAVLLNALARAAHQNIIINEKVKGKANINIAGAPWDQVFLGILRTQGLTYTWEGDIIRIMTLEDMEQDLKRESRKQDLRLVAPLETRVVKINYSEAAKLKANLEKFLTLNAEGKPLGSVLVDENTNSLIVQALRSDIDAMLPIIEELDRPTPQILIEAHIVEANKDTARDLGIQWGGLYHNGHDGNNYWITPGANTPGFGATLDTEPNPGSGAAINFPASSVTNELGMTIGYLSQSLGNYILNVQLSALQKEGKLNILSSPSITTLDNQKAIIESGKEVPYQSIEDNTVKVEYKKAVLSLEVIPHVIDGKMLRMKIFTKKDEPDFSQQVLGQPTIITKRAETNILLFDGQTTVIGGLSKETTSKSEAGVPSLKDVPLLGWLFKNDGSTGAMEDLLIFITPHILEEEPVERTAQQGTEPARAPEDSEAVGQ